MRYSLCALLLCVAVCHNRQGSGSGFLNVVLIELIKSEKAVRVHHIFRLIAPACLGLQESKTPDFRAERRDWLCTRVRRPCPCPYAIRFLTSVARKATGSCYNKGQEGWRNWCVLQRAGTWLGLGSELGLTVTRARGRLLTPTANHGNPAFRQLARGGPPP